MTACPVRVMGGGDETLSPRVGRRLVHIGGTEGGHGRSLDLVDSDFIHDRTSPTRQAVTFRDSLTGAGKEPAWTMRHNVAALKARRAGRSRHPGRFTRSAARMKASSDSCSKDWLCGDMWEVSCLPPCLIGLLGGPLLDASEAKMLAVPSNGPIGYAAGCIVASSRCRLRSQSK